MTAALRHTATRQVAVPAPFAFDVIGDNVTVNHPRWEREVLAITPRTEGPVRVGYRATMTRKDFGRTKDSDYSVTEYDPGRRIAFDHPGDAMDFALSFEVVPVGEASCQLTVDVTSRLKGALRVLAPLMGRQFPGRSDRITAAMIAVIEEDYRSSIA